MREFTAQSIYLADRIHASAGWDQCWPWALSTGSHGYGQGYDGETVALAHRLVWIHLFGDPACSPSITDATTRSVATRCT